MDQELHNEHFPVTDQMRKVLSGIDSAYQDDFDWSVYDRLYHSLRGKKFRGPVVFKTPLKLVNHHHSCVQCHYAIELDTYGRGCTHDCVYCYAKERLEFRKYWNHPIPFPIDLSTIRQLFYTVFETNRPTKWRPILEKRIPIRIGCMSDSFMRMDRKYRVTLELLRILKHYCYPYIIATRSDLVAEEAYLKALDPTLAAVQLSIVGTNESLTKRLEPGAPSIKRRLIAIRTLSQSGFWTSVRLNPLFPTYPDGYFTDPDYILSRFATYKQVPKMPIFEIDRVNEFVSVVKEHSASNLIVGFIRVSPLAIKHISEATGIPFRSFFRPETYKERGNKHYSDSEIRHYYETIKSACGRQNLRFTNCYIGNGEKDFYQYQYLWDNKIDCCDAIGNIHSFRASSQLIPWTMRKKLAPCKTAADYAYKQSSSTSEYYRNVVNKYQQEFDADENLNSKDIVWQ